MISKHEVPATVSTQPVVLLRSTAQNHPKRIITNIKKKNIWNDLSSRPAGLLLHTNREKPSKLTVDMKKTESLHQRPGLNPPAATTVTHLKVCSLICEDLREENILIGRLSNMLFTFSYKLCNRNLFLVSSSSLRDRSWKCSSCNSCIKSCFFHKITKFYFFYTLTGHM